MIEWLKRALGMTLVPSIDHLTTYRAKVVGQSSDKRTLDVQPDDNRIPGMSKVPLLLGLPGCTVDVPAGGFVRLGWRGGDPRQPYVTSWEAGEVNQIILGSPGTAEFVALANLVLDELQKIEAKFNAHTHVITATVAAANGVVPAAVTSAPVLGIQQYTASPVAASKVKAV